MVNELIHEYSHYKFYRKNRILGKTNEIKHQFYGEHSDEGEIYAHNKEYSFLEKLKDIAPKEVETKIFQFGKNWEENGDNIAKITNGWMPIHDIIDQHMIDIKAGIKNFTTIKKYNKSMVNLKIQKHLRMASILKLDLIKERWPNRVMEI